MTLARASFRFTCSSQHCMVGCQINHVSYTGVPGCVERKMSIMPTLTLGSHDGTLNAMFSE